MSMGTDGVHDGQELLFDAELRPHRSLSPKGFRILMAGIGVICLAVGLGFLLQSAWPILGFLGLDVAAIYLAFRISYRAGGLREVVQLSEQELAIRRIHPGGRWRRWSFQPYWARVRLEVEETEDVGSHGSVLVTSHGRGVHLGRFLAPEERQSFAEALGSALGRLGRH
jgi:uncharacterized membrane protein